VDPLCKEKLKVPREGGPAKSTVLTRTIKKHIWEITPGGWDLREPREENTSLARRSTFTACNKRKKKLFHIQNRLLLKGDYNWVLNRGEPHGEVVEKGEEEKG